MKNIKSLTLAVAIALAGLVTLGSVLGQSGTSADYQLDAPMANHLQAGMNEQDVFVAKERGAFRVTTADENMNAPLYATAESLEHNPGSLDDVGPYEIGKALDFSQGEWLAGQGNVSLSCENGRGAVSASFENLVPNATYTVWQSYLVMPLTVPFKVIDLPLGALDGSQNVFSTDDYGNALFSVQLDVCVPLSTDGLATVLAIAYHSDGQTYGLEPGEFGTNSHVQLFGGLPTQAQLKEAQAGH